MSGSIHIDTPRRIGARLALNASALITEVFCISYRSQQNKSAASRIGRGDSPERLDCPGDDST
jgi:hypothetical protein